eukprot:81520_1
MADQQTNILSSANVKQHTQSIQAKKSYPPLVFQETQYDYDPFPSEIDSQASTMKFITYKKKRKEVYNIYIYKVLKQVHPDIGMSNKAMAVMNGFVHDTFDRIATEAGNIVKYNGKSTMGVRAVQAAC